jgi:hypothetical protein
VTIRSRGPLISPYLHTPGHPADEPGPPCFALASIRRPTLAGQRPYSSIFCMSPISVACAEEVDRSDDAGRSASVLLMFH